MTGIRIDSGDSVSHFSVSDAATACITKNRRIIYVCVKYTVLRCDRYMYVHCIYMYVDVSVWKCLNITVYMYMYIHVACKI